MPRPTPGRRRVRDVLVLFSAGCLPLPWIAAHALGGLGLPIEVVAAFAGLAILGGAFLLTWATELAERDMPQALALLMLALVGVLPEYAVDLHFAWTVLNVMLANTEELQKRDQGMGLDEMEKLMDRLSKLASSSCE